MTTIFCYGLAFILGSVLGLVVLAIVIALLERLAEWVHAIKRGCS